VAGLTPQQHQRLLAIKGFPDGEKVTIHDLAAQRCLRHHSAVELVDRLEASLFVGTTPPTGGACFCRSLKRRRRGFLNFRQPTSEELRRLRPTLLELLNLLHEAPERR
jgi:hypothetical protein